MLNIILSTRNASKADQIKAIFNDPRFRILTLDEVGIDGEAVEDGETLGENALKKVLYAQKQLKNPTWIMADDTGLYITALNGLPGIKAARWAGDVSTEEIMRYTLKKLEGMVDRSATFKTVACLLSPTGKPFEFEGAVDGKFLTAPKTEPQPNMPYSPIFVPNGSDKVWAEMDVDEENSISHRGKAFRQAFEFFKKQL